MDDFSDILSPDGVTADLQVQNKKILFQQLSQTAAGLIGMPVAAVADPIAERERLGSTGFGRGIAIPHGRIAGLTRVTGVFARLAAPIDFRAMDDLPVDLVFLLLSPADGGVAHLQALARVSRRLRDQGFVAKLRGAGSRDALYALLASDETRHAA